MRGNGFHIIETNMNPQGSVMRIKTLQGYLESTEALKHVLESLRACPEILSVIYAALDRAVATGLLSSKA